MESVKKMGYQLNEAEEIDVNEIVKMFDQVIQ